MVFPAPFGPIRPTASPGSTDSDTSSSAVMPAKRFVMPRASSRVTSPSCVAVGWPGLAAGATVGQLPCRSGDGALLGAALAPIERSLDGGELLALYGLEDPLGVPRVGERAESKEDVLVLERDPELLEQLGEQGERQAGLDGALDGPGPDRHDEHQPEQRGERREVGGVVGLALQHGEQAAAESGDAGREREGDDA